MRFVDALTKPGLALVCDYKRRSPHQGELTDEEPAYVVSQFEQQLGADAVSVVVGTEWGSDKNDVLRARYATTLPLMAKHVPPRLIDKAREDQADAVLLVARMLRPEELVRARRRCAELGLACVIEIFDPSELAFVEDLQPDVLGINRRDLATGLFRPKRVGDIAPLVKPGMPILAESGYALGALEPNADALLIGRAAIKAVT